MLGTTKEPAGELILWIYEHAGSDGGNEKAWYTPVEKDVRDLVDLIIFRTPQMGVEKAAESFQEDLFQIRLSFMNSVDLSKELDEIGEIVNENLEEQNQKLNSGQYHGVDRVLADAYFRSLNTYLKVSNSILNFKEEIGQAFQDLSKEEERGVQASSYQDLVKKLSQGSNTSFPQFLLKYLEASLCFDFGTIVTDLVLNDKMKLVASEKKETSRLLLSSIEDFGLNASLMGLWEPDEDDEEQIVRNIKIRKAYLAARNGESEPYYLDDLKEKIEDLFATDR